MLISKRSFSATFSRESINSSFWSTFLQNLTPQKQNNPPWFHHWYRSIFWRCAGLEFPSFSAVSLRQWRYVRFWFQILLHSFFCQRMNTQSLPLLEKLNVFLLCNKFMVQIAKIQNGPWILRSAPPGSAPAPSHTCLESVESANWISARICSQILFLANT